MHSKPKRGSAQLHACSVDQVKGRTTWSERNEWPRWPDDGSVMTGCVRSSDSRRRMLATTGRWLCLVNGRAPNTIHGMAQRWCCDWTQGWVRSSRTGRVRSWKRGSGSSLDSTGRCGIARLGGTSDQVCERANGYFKMVVTCGSVGVTGRMGPVSAHVHPVITQKRYNDSIWPLGYK
jgi:hypothetical protein